MRKFHFANVRFARVFISPKSFKESTMTVSISPTNLAPEIVKNNFASDDNETLKQAAIATPSRPVPHTRPTGGGGTIVILKSK